MKNLIGIVAVFFLSLFVFTACTDDELSGVQEDILAIQELSASDIDFDNLGITGRTEEGIETDETEQAERVIIEELVKSDACEGEVVSGVVEFYKESQKVGSIDFGNGECDGVATVTFTNEDGESETKEIAFQDAFRKPKHGKKGGKECSTDDEKGERPHHPKPCFDFVFPVSFSMSDDSVITLDNEEDKSKLKAWHEANPDVKERPALQFPVTITFEDGTTKTINSDDEMKEAHEECKSDKADSETVPE